MCYRFLKLLVFLSCFAAVQKGAAQTYLSSSFFSKAIIATDCNSYVLLQWNVTDNTKVDHYEVQRMNTGGSYQTIALVLSDNLEQTKQFLYKDKITVRGMMLNYRIRVIFTDQKELYSDAVAVEAPSVQNEMITIMYEAAGDKVAFELPGVQYDYVYRFYNIMGKLIKVISAKNKTVAIADLKNGSYFAEAFQPQTGRRYYGEFRKMK
jgi:hypothetical protein